MKRLLLCIGLLALFAATAAEAQITKPVRYTWITTSCANWNCAASALVLANGSPDVIVLPTNDETHPWLVLKRVEEGSLFIPEDEPFNCEVFDGVAAASARFAAMDSCHAPIILNVPDGRAIVTSLAKCPNAAGGRRRAASH